MVVSLVPLIASTWNAGAHSMFEAFSEVLGHKSVHYGIDTTVEVGHDSETLAHVLEVAIV